MSTITYSGFCDNMVLILNAHMDDPSVILSGEKKYYYSILYIRILFLLFSHIFNFYTADCILPIVLTTSGVHLIKAVVSNVLISIVFVFIDFKAC